MPVKRRSDIQLDQPCSFLQAVNLFQGFDHNDVAKDQLAGPFFNCGVVAEISIIEGARGLGMNTEDRLGTGEREVAFIRKKLSAG
jgi:hypothetical protein